MRALSDTSGQYCFSEASGADGYTELSYERKRQFKELIAKANTVPIKSILSWYGVFVDDYSKRCSCPFNRKHKGGRDNTPSFYFYPETNTFHCFGCKAGRTPVDFVSIILNVNKIEAARKILEKDPSTKDAILIDGIESTDYYERNLLIIDFSNFVRDFYKYNAEDRGAIDFMDKICNAFDSICSKHDMSNDSIKSLIDKLKAKTEKYIKCHLF